MLAAYYRDLELPYARGVDGERRRQPQARVQRIAIDIWYPAKSQPGKKKKLSTRITKPNEIGTGRRVLARRREPTEVGELRGAALELELVSGEGLEPVLERVLQRPRYDRLHLPERPGRFPWSGAARAVVGGGAPPDRR